MTTLNEMNTAGYWYVPYVSLLVTPIEIENST